MRERHPPDLSSLGTDRPAAGQFVAHALEVHLKEPDRILAGRDANTAIRYLIICFIL
jgi:hypothetical protein